MTSWRPEGWENPYPDKPENYDWAIEDDIPSALALEMRQRAYEAGADAMLKLLREQGSPTMDSFGEGPYTSGVSVFIPDDEKENK